MKTQTTSETKSYRVKSNSIRIRLVNILFLFTLTNVVFSQVIKLSFGEVVNQSDLIFIGTVENQYSYMNDKNTMIFTDVTFSGIQTVCYSDLSVSNQKDIINLTYAGGEINGKSVMVSDMPSFIIGKRYLLCTHDNGEVYANPIIGACQGQFELLEDEVGGTEYIITSGGKVIWGIDNDELTTSSLKVSVIRNGSVKFEKESRSDIGQITTPPLCTDPQFVSTSLSQEKDNEAQKPISQNEFTNLIKSIWHQSSGESNKIDGGYFYFLENSKITKKAIPDTPHSGTLILPGGNAGKSSGNITPNRETLGGQLGYCGYQNVNIVMGQVGNDWQDYWPNNNAMSDWNKFMDVYRLNYWDGSYGPDNGQSEFYSFWSDNSLVQTFQMHWGSAIGYCFWWGQGNCGKIDETDIVLNQGWSWTDNIDIAMNSSNIILLSPVIMHELGHSWGAQRDPSYPETYDYDLLSVMQQYYFGLYETGRGIHFADAYLFRRDYDNQVSILTITDVGVESYYASGGLHNSTTDRVYYDAGDNITLYGITGENMSYHSIQNVNLRFYLSSDRYITTNDYKLGGSWQWDDMSAEAYYSGDFSTQIPSNIPAGQYYVGMIMTVNGFSEDDYSHNNSTSLANPIMVYNSSGMAENEFSGSVMLYPNPVIDDLTIEIQEGNNLNSYSLLIYDLTGKLVVNEYIKEQFNKINLNNLVPGMYIAKIASGHSYLTRKFIKK
jgi:hypothetical protein